MHFLFDLVPAICYVCVHLRSGIACLSSGAFVFERILDKSRMPENQSLTAGSLVSGPRLDNLLARNSVCSLLITQILSFKLLLAVIRQKDFQKFISSSVFDFAIQSVCLKARSITIKALHCKVHTGKLFGFLVAPQKERDRCLFNH